MRFLSLGRQGEAEETYRINLTIGNYLHKIHICVSIDEQAG